MKFIVLLFAVALLLLSCNRASVKVLEDQADDVVVFPAFAAIKNSDQAGTVHAQSAAYTDGVKGIWEQFEKLEEKARMAARKGWLWGIAMVLMVGSIASVVLWVISKNSWFITGAIAGMVGSIVSMGIAHYLCEFWKLGAGIVATLVIGGLGYTIYYARKERRMLVGSLKYGQDLEKKVDEVSVNMVRDLHRDAHKNAGIYSGMKKLVNEVRGDD